MTIRLRDPKDPDAVEPFEWDWTGWLEEGDSIASFELIADGIGVDSSTEADGVVTAVVSGGTAGEFAQVTCRITTANGYVNDRTLVVRIQER